MAKSEFSEGKKNVEDAKYEKAHGKKGEEVSQGKEGLVQQNHIYTKLIHTYKKPSRYSSGAEAVKDVKGEEGYYANKAGAKNVVEDGKQYQGGQQYNQEGTNTLVSNKTY